MIFEDECNNFESDIEIQGKKLGWKKKLKEKGEKLKEIKKNLSW